MAGLFGRTLLPFQCFIEGMLGNIQSELSFCQQDNPQVIDDAFIYHYLNTSKTSKNEKCQPSEIEANQPCNHVMQPRLDSKPTPAATQTKRSP